MISNIPEIKQEEQNIKKLLEKKITYKETR